MAFVFPRVLGGFIAVVAAGIRSKPLADRLRLQVPIESERGSHVEIDGLSAGPGIPMMIQDRKVAITRMAKGLRVAGQVELAGVEAEADWRRAEVLKTHLLGVFPGLAPAIRDGAARMWLGHRPSTPDGRPVIGRSPHPDVLVAYGHGHIGLATGPRTSLLIMASPAWPEIGDTLGLALEEIFTGTRDDIQGALDEAAFTAEDALARLK